MRKLVLVSSCVFCAVALSARAQNPDYAGKEGSAWQRVQALPPGTEVLLRTTNRQLRCKIHAADAESITCVPGGKQMFQRTEVTSVKISHRARSAAIAAGIGAGAASILGAVGTDRCTSFCLGPSRGEIALAGALGGAIIGAPIGYFANFGKSTIYKVP